MIECKGALVSFEGSTTDLSIDLIEIHHAFKKHLVDSGYSETEVAKLVEAIIRCSRSSDLCIESEDTER